MAIEIPFVGQSYNMDSLDISAQRSINLYPESYQDGKTKTITSLRATHGLSLFVTLGGSNLIRGMYLSSTGTLYTVQGSRVSSVSTAGGETALFNIGTGNTNATSTIVRLADTLVASTAGGVVAGEVNMLIADGSTGAYVWNITNSVATKITDTAYPGGSFCGVLDGFFIVNKPGTLFAYYSNLDDPFTWSSLQTLTKESTTDHINGLIVADSRVWLFGSQSHEVHYNTGNSNAQFARIQGTESGIGLQAPNSLTQDANSIFFLGASAQGFGKVFMSQGFEVVPISTVPIERAIHNYTSTSDAEGLCFQQDGHNFYQLTFPTDNKTWVYDTTTGLWHEKLYRNPVSSIDERHRARGQVFFNGKNYMSDWENGNIYEVSQSTYTDNGNPIIRTRISPTTWNANERIYYSSFELDVESGVGLTTGQGSNPLLRFSWSNDGGHNFQDPRLLSIGKIGKFRTRVKQNRLGCARYRVWKVEYSEPTKFTILSAHVEVE